ncbi:MAG: dihydrodipicolinate synthase family protein [Rhodospirillales bacterium]|nr:dihydrodipicolinate synthase family protein [Rhodospirillales bacterium]
MATLRLPVKDGPLALYTMGEPRDFGPAPDQPLCRAAMAAPHMVSNPLAHTNPWTEPVVAWDDTLKYRRYLWGLGLGVAEAMDTAHRGSGLDWPTALKLIELSIAESKDFPGAVLFSGAGTDHLDIANAKTVNDVIAAFDVQCSAIEKLGGRIILMASRALARVAGSPDDYAKVYEKVLSRVRNPVIIHWLGEMFDFQLAGYWGSRDPQAAMENCLDVIAANVDKIEGVKISLLDKDLEIKMRRRLPKQVKMYTGDDFNYPELIEGDSEGFSHALLGIFDPIAPAVTGALSALTSGDRNGYAEIMAPTIPLARHIFRAPTQYFKTGVVFMAYLNGHQPHFIMMGGQQSAHSLPYLADVFRLADQAGLIADPDRAVNRMKTVLRLYGIEG